MQTFERYEKKYLLNPELCQKFLKEISSHLTADKHPNTKIHSIYYDTPNFQLIRRSIEKPEYKEKLRVRTYNDDLSVFVELKKKFKGVVYKRRTKANRFEVLKDINSCTFEDEQVGREIKYFLDYYKNIKPAIYIGCERFAFVTTEGIRITIDKNMKYRLEDLSLDSNIKDKPITDYWVMEIKAVNAYPLWLSDSLSKNNIFPRGFSKVGTAYLKEIERY